MGRSQGKGDAISKRQRGLGADLGRGQLAASGYTNSDGSLERYKARLVARGFDQRYGLDYDETFCPVVRLESLRTLIALSTQQELELHHVDVHTAFLNGTLQEEVYMKEPIGYEKEGKEHLVCD